jgi:hypothetical protein
MHTLSANSCGSLVRTPCRRKQSQRQFPKPEWVFEKKLKYCQAMRVVEASAEPDARRTASSTRDFVDDRLPGQGRTISDENFDYQKSRSNGSSQAAASSARERRDGLDATPPQTAQVPDVLDSQARQFASQDPYRESLRNDDPAQAQRRAPELSGGAYPMQQPYDTEGPIFSTAVSSFNLEYAIYIQARLLLKQLMVLIVHEHRHFFLHNYSPQTLLDGLSRESSAITSECGSKCYLCAATIAIVRHPACPSATHPARLPCCNQGQGRDLMRRGRAPRSSERRHCRRILHDP